MNPRRKFLQRVAITGLIGVSGCSTEKEYNTPVTEEASKTHGSSPTETDTEPSSDKTPTHETESNFQDTEMPPQRVGTERILWESNIGYSAKNPLTLTSGGSLLVGDSNGVVARLDVSDGSVEWEYNADLPIQSSPVLVDNTVIVIEGQYNEHFRVHGIDIDTGTRRWKFKPEKDRLNFIGESDGVVFVATADQNTQSRHDVLYALSSTDGKIHWSSKIGENRGGIVTDDTVYIAGRDSLTAISTNGSKQWTYLGSDDFSDSLAVAGNTIAAVVGLEDRKPSIHGLDVSTGERRWVFDDWRAFSLRTEGDLLVVGGENLARVDPATGEPQWKSDLQVARLSPRTGENDWVDSWQTALSEAVLTDDTLFVGGTTAAAIAVNDGSTKWKTDLGTIMDLPVEQANNRMIFHSSNTSDDQDRHLFALDSGTGEKQWEYAGRFRLSSPVAGKSRVFFAESRSGLVALEL